MTTPSKPATRCHIVLTNTARNAIKQHFQDEHALFNLQQAFTVYIEKESIENQQIQLGLYFDPSSNERLAQKFPERVVIMDCLFDLKSGLVAKSFRTRGKGTPVETNRREKMRIHFVPTRINGHKYPESFIKTLAELPVSKDRFEYVNKRITSWEGYLKVLDKNAAIEDIQAKFSKHVLSADCAHLTLQLTQVDGKQWKQLKGLSARIRGIHQEIGEVVKVHRADHTVEIELKPDMAAKARKGQLDFNVQDVEFSNASTKSQLKRLLKGFERLKEGLAANANLETILFEDKPKLAARKTKEPLVFHNQLNEFQRAAVTGAMESEDLYVIQGPPGTGKTTVISEICTQNARAGLKTLVASQSNLAVDNALSRLLSNKDIRILRYGRTESIEEEGKKFIEENVAGYWKQQTYDAICQEITNHSTKEQSLKGNVQALQEEKQQLAQKLAHVEIEIAAKKEAEQQLPTIKSELSALQKELTSKVDQADFLAQTLQKLQQAQSTIQAQLAAAKQKLEDLGSAQGLTEQLEQTNSNLVRAKDELEALQLKAQLQSITQQLSHQKAVLQKELTLDNTHQQALTKVANLKKVYEVEEFMQDYALRRSFVMDRLLSALERLQQEYEKFKPLNDLKRRLDKAVNYCRTVLGIDVGVVSLPPNHHYSIAEVEEFITKLSHAIAEKRINASNGQRSVEGLHMRFAYINEQMYAFEATIDETKIIFARLKEEIARQFKEQEDVNEANTHKLQAEVAQTTLRHDSLKQQFDALNKQFDQLRSMEEIQADRMRLERLQKTCVQQLEDMTVQQAQLQNATQKNAALAEQIEENQQAITTNAGVVEQLTVQTKEKTTQFEQANQLLKTNPEQMKADIQARLNAIEQELAKLETELVLLPMTEQIQLEWKTMLESASEYDLEEIRKLYVKHSNVIGTTCVASANKQFMDSYPTFDVVIIDEVSKATPPELLLPMLKGAKIILVGDHHQLPPLIGDETFEETLEQVLKDNKSFEQKRELEKLLEESLFERLYKNVPSTNKTMLAIQYRMHENIMKTIAPFYKNASEELQCGLPNSDEARDHKLKTSLFDRKHHLLWVDIPNESPYFEQRMKEGSSLFNEAELAQIRKMLLEMNEATASAKANGDIPEDALKSVGVISFYAEQVKRINRMLEQELQLPHLHIRTGSVDKFQGMEMDVIIVSMVRNNNGQGDIGFAKDYRRLNVALSRARELLICLGSTEMFTKKAKKQETRDMYQHVLDEVKAQDGYRKMEGAIK